MAPPPTERTRLPADKRRALILRAAGEHFARGGYADTRLEDIAAAAHVTKLIVYRHFASKKDLYLALFTKHAEDLPSFTAGAVASGPDPDADPDQVTRAILEVWLDYVRENGYMWLVIFRDATGDAEIEAARDALNVRARDVMAELVEARSGGSIPAEQIQPLAEVLMSGLAALALWWIEHPETPKEVVVDVAVRLAALGVGP